MPYSSISELPEGVKNNLPARAARIYMAAVNSALKTYDGNEETAAKVAWSAVKKKFKKDKGGKWVAKTQGEIMGADRLIADLREVYARYYAQGAPFGKQTEVQDTLIEAETDLSVLPRLREIEVPSFGLDQAYFGTLGGGSNRVGDFPGSLDH